MSGAVDSLALAEALDLSIRVAWRSLCRSRRQYRANVAAGGNAAWRDHWERWKLEDRAVLLALFEVRREAREAGR